MPILLSVRKLTCKTCFNQPRSSEQGQPPTFGGREPRLLHCVMSHEPSMSSSPAFYFLPHCPCPQDLSLMVLTKWSVPSPCASLCSPRGRRQVPPPPRSLLRFHCLDPIGEQECSIPVLCWEYYHFLPSFLMLLGQRLYFPSKLDVNFEKSDRNEAQLWGCMVASATTVG